MQTLTGLNGKAGLHVFEESIAEFLCVRGSWLLFGTELIKLRVVLRFGHPNLLSRSTSRFCCVQRSIGARGGLVVKALRYKPAGRGFDSRWCHWNFSVI